MRRKYYIIKMSKKCQFMQDISILEVIKSFEAIGFREIYDGARYKIRTCDHLHVMEALYR